MNFTLLKLHYPPQISSYPKKICFAAFKVYHNLIRDLKVFHSSYGLHQTLHQINSASPPNLIEVHLSSSNSRFLFDLN